MAKLPTKSKQTVAQTVMAGGVALSLSAPLDAASQSVDTAYPAVIMGALPADKESAQFLNGGENGNRLSRLAQTSAAEFTASDASGDPGTPIPIVISTPTTQATNYTFVMIRGIPPEFQVSSGIQTKGAWIVSLQDLKTLTITPPSSFDGVAPLEILLIRGRDVEPESRKITVTARAPKTRQPVLGLLQSDPRKALEPSVPNPAARAAPVSPQAAPAVTQSEETALLTSAAAAMKQGTISAARIMFEELASRGSAKGAFALAQTYDPVMLTSTAISGIKPDLAKAQFWYEKAKELGSQDAEKRLAEMRASK